MVAKMVWILETRVVLPHKLDWIFKLRTLPQSLPRTSAHVSHRLLPRTFHGASVARLASASIGAEKNVRLSKQST